MSRPDQQAGPLVEADPNSDGVNHCSGDTAQQGQGQASGVLPMLGLALSNLNMVADRQRGRQPSSVNFVGAGKR